MQVIVAVVVGITLVWVEACTVVSAVSACAVKPCPCAVFLSKQQKIIPLDITGPAWQTHAHA